MNVKWLKWILAAVVLLALPVIVGVYGVSIVQASTGSEVVRSEVGLTVLAHPRFRNGTVDMQALLADELGISVEDLESAQQAALEDSIAVAIEEGKLTQEEADQLLERGGLFGRGFGLRGFGMHGFGPSGWESGSSYNTLLAGGLGITAEELQTAQQSAREAALDQLVEEGILIEEQLENAKATAELRAYLNRASLSTEALGMSSEEWEAAKDAGKSLSEIMEEQGVDAATYRENIAAASEAAIEQAVIDGVISQEEADNLGSGRPFGLGPDRGFGPGRGGYWGELPEGFKPGDGFGPGPGGFRGRGPFGPPGLPGEDATNTTSA